MAVLSASQRAIVQWVIDYMETGGAGDGHIDQTASDQLARVFRNMCGFSCGCPGGFQEGLDDTPYTTLLRVLLCLSEQTGVSAADLAVIQWVIDYMERGGSGHSHFDQKASDELARVFRDSCGFVCGCPGTFQTGLLQSPITTLLRAILCADEGGVGIGTEGGESGSLLLAACGFGILAATTITNTGPSVIDGDLGLSPGTSVTGFPPGLVLGETHVTDVIAANAQLALTAAYLDLEGRGGSTPVAGDIGGMTLTPGVYKSTSSLAVTTANLTLDAQGNADAVFIFQIASTLLISSARQIILTGGAQAKNVLWQVGSSATLSTTSVFKGSILALTSISVATGATVEGRLLARNGAITLDSNSVVVPPC